MESSADVLVMETKLPPSAQPGILTCFSSRQMAKVSGKMESPSLGFFIIPLFPAAEPKSEFLSDFIYPNPRAAASAKTKVAKQGILFLKLPPENMVEKSKIIGY